MKIKWLAVFISLLILIAPQTAFAEIQILGKKDSPTGQNKKVDVNVGKVEEVKEDKLEIQTNKGKKVEVQTRKDTKIFEKPGGRELALGQLKKNDLVATVSEATDATGSADLILVKKESTESAKPETRRRAVYGLVREINGNILVISHPIKDNPRYNVEVVDSTVIKIKDITSPTIGDIQVGDRVAAVGRWSGDNLVAKRVHVIPGRAIGLLEKVATGSASPTATPSASPINSPVPTP